MTPKKKDKPTLKTYLFTGILVTAPVAITLYAAFMLIQWIDGWVTGFIPAKYNPETYLPYGVPGLGVVILLVFLILVGMLTANFVGRAMENLWEKLIGKMPVISGLYNALKKIFETIFGSGKETAYRQPVLIEYPRKGLWTIAFVTGPVYKGVQRHVKDKLIGVYVPTTPNPTSGFLIYVPQKDVIELDMSIDAAFKIVISTGIVNPDVKEKMTRKH